MTVERLGARDIPVAELTYFPGNARRGNLAEIRKSVKRLGQYRSVVVRHAPDGLVILAGNHTVQAMTAEGHATAYCDVIRCTDDEAIRVNVADNRLSDIADNDPDELVQLLSYLDDDYEGTGWTATEVEALIGPPDIPPGGGDPDDTPEPPAEPVTRPGELWLLGPPRLLCGDATSPGDLARVMEGLGTPGIVYTDPPYGVDVVSRIGKVGGGGPFGGVKANKGGKVIASSVYRPVAGDETTDVARDAFALLSAEFSDALHVWWGGNHYTASAGLPDSSCWLVWDKEN